MIEQKNPFEIAREALKQLTANKLSPTPANFQTYYNEVAKLPNVAGFPEAQLRQIASALPVSIPEQKPHLDRLEAAIGKRSWRGVQDALNDFASAHTIVSTANAEPATGPDCQVSEHQVALLERITQWLESLLPALGSDDQWLSDLGLKLLQAFKGPAEDGQELLTLLASFSRGVSLATEEQREIRQTLLKLLQLIIENISELTLDQEFIQGQIDSLIQATHPPITLRRLDDVERRLHEVISRQRQAKERSLEAQESMRQMLTAFIDHLRMLNQSSSNFQNDLEQSSRQIAEVRTIEDLAPLLKQVIDATRGMTEDTANACRQLDDLQDRVLATNAELRRLHAELHHASISARHDSLTDVLNRRGFDEALAREIASVRRKNSPLCLSLMDLDNFKRINDHLGHLAGDAALVHLVKVLRQHMRSIDTLARYGGEEFVILMPDTPLEEGIETIKRLQRELTRNFFLANNERVLITFSAGVAQLGSDESGEDAMLRADQAMYMAKRMGKNRVVGV
ncbi:MAG: GGDEF domain-containing protein [Accumulibacter sp.]|jgi:diguanylate cyclase|uniref:sensor domain-containing diguanylate cyclase n=1 Tax=Accumulibacter sp. TaxID=2053492 RepID=UPI002FC2EDFE